MPHGDNFVGDPVLQVVVPSKFRTEVLKAAHDHCGHLGVRKTYLYVLRYFFWPCVKGDVASYIRTCSTCQLTGKHQGIKPAPLYPIQVKMKHLYDRKAEQHQFSPGHRVLALLPLVTAPFQAKFTGPFTVLRQVSEQNYLLSTPKYIRC